MAELLSVNSGAARPNPHKDVPTGIHKTPVAGPVEVRAPGPRGAGLGSGLVGDYIGDAKHHGGNAQALYAFQREDLDAWEQRLDRELACGLFGENLTVRGLEINDAPVGQRWRIGDTVVVQVTSPRTPCATFRGWIDEPRWLKTFTAAARPGAYLSVVTPGSIEAGDPIEVIHTPEHGVTVALVFRATLTDRDLLPSLLAAGDDLDPGTRRLAEQRTMITLDT